MALYKYISYNEIKKSLSYSRFGSTLVKVKTYSLRKFYINKRFFIILVTIEIALSKSRM